MTIRPFSRWDRDYITATGVVMKKPGGEVLTPVVTIALVPVGTKPTDSVIWHDTVSRTEGPSLLVVGASADATDAVVLTQSMDAYGKFEAGGVSITQFLGRVPYRP